MAEINAEFNDVLDAMSAKIGSLEKENAILVARLRNASDQIDSLTNPADPKVVEPAAPEIHNVTTLPAPEAATP